jgi:hypothetical protein
VLQGATAGTMNEELPPQGLLPRHNGPVERPRRPRDPRYEAAVLSLLSTAAKKHRSSGPSAERLGPGASAVAAEEKGERAKGCVNLQWHCVSETCSLSTSRPTGSIFAHSRPGHACMQ